MRRTISGLALLTLTACASFDPPVYVRGNEASTTNDPVKLAALRAIAAQLHSPEMEAAIAAAKPGVPR